MEGNKLSLHMLGIKAKTKNELYRLLTTEANLYLPPQRETSIYFVRDIIHGRKRVLLIEFTNLCRLSLWKRSSQDPYLK